MASNKSEWRVQIRRALGFTTGAEPALSDAQLDLVISQALSIFSRRSPRRRVYQGTGDGGYEYALPSDYDESISEVVAVEYPTGEQQPCILEAWRYEVLRDTNDTLKLRFLYESVTSGETFNVYYTAPHVINDSQSTIPSGQEGIFLTLCCAIACEMLAARYARMNEPVIDADVAIYADKAREYRLLAQQYRQQFENAFPQGAQRIVDWDVWLRAARRDRLIHRRGVR